MFSYYGSKSKVVHLYPAPKYPKIIEPFAGSARYALKWWDRDILLVDKYEVIIGVWKWLQQASPKDVLSLPELKAGQKIDRKNFDCVEQAWLMGFLMQHAVRNPKLTCSTWGARDIKEHKNNIANQLYKIKHWTIQLDSFENIPNQDATWFIDPPYQTGGYVYAINKIDYSNLANWSQARQGQVIVCENTKANWLPFWPLKSQMGIRKVTTEAIWCNDIFQPALL